MANYFQKKPPEVFYKKDILKGWYSLGFQMDFNCSF